MSLNQQHRLAVDEQTRMENEEMLHRAFEFARARAAQRERGNDSIVGHQNGAVAARERETTEENSRKQNPQSVEASPAAGEAAPERELKLSSTRRRSATRQPRRRPQEFATVLGRQTACEGHRDGTCECPAPSQELLTAVIRKLFGDLRNELDIIFTVFTREGQRVLTREDLPDPQQRLAILNERLDVVVRALAVVERDIAIVEGEHATERERRAAIVRERARADQAWAAAETKHQRREAEMIAGQKRTLRHLIRGAYSPYMLEEYFHVVEAEWYEFHLENLGVPDVLWWGRDPVAHEDVRRRIDREIAEIYAITRHLEELVRLRAEGGRIDLEEW
ncbi:hypothetical protein CSOJ01_08654 [Colletotrichum sojae]|uniref:Uncharacterized protein n=1 Tax=Colletotrichum sojae TaxID=2175907 RepID=A0A8H6J673_9PEZI|nr:hypothetical protein CSOJ01_08654 [Colletotrichum sojae]